MDKKQHMTILHGKDMCRKDDPRICFRGELDGVMACVAYGAALAQKDGNDSLSASLSDVNRCLMLIMSAHYKNDGAPLDLPKINGRDMEEIHEISHDPVRHFGHYHFIPKPEYGPALSWLNVIRTRVRDAERALVACYEGEPDENICRAINRVSSALFVMMCEENARHYVPEEK